MAKTKESGGYKWKGVPAPEFISLSPGQMVEGVYMGHSDGQYGPVYRIRLEDGRMVALGGNRVQLDVLMSDFEAEYPGMGKGLWIAIRRLSDQPTKAGRTVGQYQIAVVPEKSKVPPF